MTLLLALFLMAFEPPSAGVEKATPGALVVGIDAEEFVRGMFPSIGKSLEDPGVVDGRVAKKFSVPGGVVELQYAIYPDRSMAKSALSRTMPQLVASAFRDDRSEGFVSARAAHVRIDNMILLLFLASEESAGSPAEALARLREAVALGQGIRRGAKVNTPAIKILEVTKEKKPTLNGRAKVVFEPAEGAESLLLPRRGVEKRTVGVRERIEITIERGPLDSEPVLRLVRPTGEALELPVSQMVAAGVDTKELESPPKQVGIPEDEKQRMIGVLRSGHGGLKEQVQLMARLSEAPSPDLRPFFEEVLASQKSSVLKQHALAGLAALEGGEGVADYRRIAADRQQPVSVRLDAVRLIGRHGSLQDLSLLSALESEWDQDADRWVRLAIEEIRAREIRSQKD